MQTNPALQDVHTWGIRFTDAPDIDHVCSALLDGFRGKPSELPLVVTPNVDIMVTLETAEPYVKETVRAAAMVLPDGQPLVSLSRFAGGVLQARLPGSDLTEALWPELVAQQRSTFAIVPNVEVAERLAIQHPKFGSLVAPMVPAESGTLIDRFAWECIEAMSAMDEMPEFVFLGIGFPKDPLLGRSIIDQWPAELGDAPMVIAVGASLEFITGLKKRAPEVFQRLGIEWMHRVVSEPRRMIKRYFIRDARFLLILARHVVQSAPAQAIRRRRKR